MSIMKWDERFDLGVETMDGQHRQLIDLMNRVHDLAHAGAGKKAVVDAINTLAEYTVKHFREEEEYMDRIGFPEAKTHKVVHERLLKTFGEHVESIEAGDGSVPDKFFSFLQFWLSAHICNVDKKYGNFSLQKSA